MENKMWITPHRSDLLNSISKCYWTPTMTSSPKGNQPWIFIGRTDAKAEAPIFWPPDGKSWLIGKDPDAGKDWREKEKRAVEDEMVGWHHRLNGHKFKSKLQKIVEWHTAWTGILQSMGLQRVRHHLVTEQWWQQLWHLPITHLCVCLCYAQLVCVC